MKEIYETRQRSHHLFERYLRILGIEQKPPEFNGLNELVQAQMARVPFENISKLYYKKRLRLRGLIDFERYLDGIERYHFGGTCYANNYYFHLLLKYLGYDIWLCGADMTNPDVHLLSMARLDSREYIIDVGYAAPFTMPLPRDLAMDFSIEHGEDCYVLKPRHKSGRSRMEMFRNGQPFHGYVAKPEPRKIEEFAGVIADSFSDKATFMNAIMLVKFWPGKSLAIRNLSVVETDGNGARSRPLSGRNKLIGEIERLFGIDSEIAAEAIGEIRKFGDAWS